MSAKVITIQNSKGGSGKTTTAINLCGSLREKGKRAMVFDVDIDKPDAYRWQKKGEDIDWVYLLNNKENIANEINNFKNKYDYIIIDSPPNLISWGLKAVLLADYVIIPSSVSPLDTGNTEESVQIPLMANKPFKILMNRVKKGTKESKQLFEDNKNTELKFETVITERTDMLRCISVGKWVGEYSLNCDSHMQYNLLADEIISWVDITSKTEIAGIV